MPDNEMIINLLHVPSDKDKLLFEHDTSSVKELTAEYKVDNKTVYYISNQI